MTPDPDEDAVTFKELCGCFHAALSLGPCVLLLDGVNDLGGAIGLSPQEVWVTIISAANVDLDRRSYMSVHFIYSSVPGIMCSIAW